MESDTLVTGEGSSKVEFQSSERVKKSQGDERRLPNRDEHNMENPNNQEEDAIVWNDDTADDEEARIELGLVGKIWTTRSINKNAFMTTMKNVWQPAFGIDITSIGENTYVFQFHHWKDKLRVMEGQPWHFDRHAILLSNIHGNTKPSDMTLFELPMWVRVYNLPFKGRLNRDNMEAMGRKIGEFVKADNSGSVGIDKSIRLRINVDVRKPLVQKIRVKMRGGEDEFFEVKYEKPPLFCYYCGRMGHGVKDCPECRDEEDPDTKFGEWIKASPWKKVSMDQNRERNKSHGSCAKALFITKPKLTIKPKEREEVQQMVGKIIEINLEEERVSAKTTPEQLETGGSLEDEVDVEGNNPARTAPFDTQQGIVGVEIHEKTPIQRKKGWKKKAREGGTTSSGGREVSGVRRKIREDEMETDELHEGETCGIKKKIGLDATLLKNKEEVTTSAKVASPTSWALGGQ